LVPRNQVIAFAAPRRVITAPALNDIFTSATVERIVTVIALDYIVPVPTQKRVVAATPGNRVIEQAAD
jgi:hypothetical protein